MEGISISELIAELQAKYPNISQSGDIDKSSILFSVINKMRIFGVNALETTSDFLDVENSKTQLPEDFKALKFACLAEPMGYEIEGNRIGVTDNFIYKQRIESPAYFNEVTKEYVTSCRSKLVTETITLGNSRLKYHYYRKPLELVDGVREKAIAQDCKNIGIKSFNKISIRNSILNTNFSKGRIYIEYYSLPMNEEGELVIPIYSTGAIYDYIENCAKIEIIEYIINNGLNPQGLSDLYKVYKGQEIPMKSSAMKEAKFKGLGKDWDKKFRRNIDSYYNRFNLR